MIPIFREGDCPLSSIQGWTMAVVGYGNQGSAHARNLRDSGLRVIVSGREGGSGLDRAAADGFPVVSLEEAAAADLVALLTPDAAHKDVVGALKSARGRIAPPPEGGSDGTGADQPGVKVLVFAHSFALRFDPPAFDETWDVIVVAPAGPGEQLRSRFVAGGGIPALLAVYQDGSGKAGERGRAYGAAIGCARAGLLETTAAEEAEIDLFGEQAVLCGGMNALCTAAFDVLVQAGYPEELAYLECVQQLRLTAELVERFGVEGMRRRISPAALFGDLTRGPRIADEKTRFRLNEILGEIRGGVFAREYLERSALEPDWAEAELGNARHETLERAGAVIRGLEAPGRPGTSDAHESPEVPGNAQGRKH